MRKFSILAMLAVVLLFSACKSEKKEQEATTSETTTDNTTQTVSPVVHTVEFNGKKIPITIFYDYESNNLDSLVFEYNGTKQMLNFPDKERPSRFPDYSSENVSHYIPVDDYNFDGYMDIKVYKDEGDNEYYDVFMYDPQAKSYYYHEKLSWLTAINIDKEMQTLESFGSQGNPCYFWKGKYKWVKRELVEIESENQDYNDSLKKFVLTTKIFQDDTTCANLNYNDDNSLQKIRATTKETQGYEDCGPKVVSIEEFYIRTCKSNNTVKIGTQTWMAQNLNDSSKGGKCYDNDPKNCEKYGRLYTWEEAMKACPSGWHLPSDDEWQTLVDFAGGKDVAGGKLKAKSGWIEGGNGTDEFGFSALPGGCWFDEGSFVSVGNYGSWWSATEIDSSEAGTRNMFYGSDVQKDGTGLHDKSRLLSVRCIKGDL